MDDSTPERSERKPRSRRRTLIGCVLLLLVGMGAGAAAGWASAEPLYRSRGLVYIVPPQLSPANPLAIQVLPMFEGYVAYQVALLKSPRTALMAMETDVWKSQGEGSGPEALGAFHARCRIEHLRGTQHIALGFVDREPAVALAGVQALLAAYVKLSEDLGDANANLEYARAQVEVLNGKVKAITEEILTITAAYGGVEGLTLRHRASVAQLLEAEETLAKLRETLRNGNDAEAAPGGGAHGVPAREIALENAAMADLLLQLGLLEAEETYLAGRLSAQSDRLLEVRRKIAVFQRRIEEMTVAWNRARHVETTGGATPEDLKAREARLVAHLEQLRAQARRIGQARADVERVLASKSDLERQLTEMSALKRELTAHLVGKGRIRIADPGSLPAEPWCDVRGTRALTWGGLGALPGLLALLFLGLLAPRVRRD